MTMKILNLSTTFTVLHINKNKLGQINILKANVNCSSCTPDLTKRIANSIEIMKCYTKPKELK